MILVDTSGLLAALFPDQAFHAACARVLGEAEGRPLVLSPFILAELDYLIGEIGGVEPELALLDEVRRGVYDLEPFDGEDVGEAHELVGSYRDLGIGLADASLVVLARRWQTNDLLTLDQRHFRTLPGYRGRSFRLLPFDQELS